MLLYITALAGMVFNGSTRDFQSFGLGSNPGSRSARFLYHLPIFINMGRKQKQYHYIYKTTNLINRKYYIGMHYRDWETDRKSVV